MIAWVWIFLYLFVGWFGSYMAERFYGKHLFGSKSWQLPRSVVVSGWPVALIVYGLYLACDKINNSGLYERLEKKLRGF